MRKRISLLAVIVFGLSGFCGSAVADTVTEELPCSYTLTGHDSAVVYLNFLSDDPMILLSASEDGTIILWSIPSVLGWRTADSPLLRLTTIPGSVPEPVDFTRSQDAPSDWASIGKILLKARAVAPVPQGHESQITLDIGSSTSYLQYSSYRLSGHTDDVTCLAFSPAVDFLVSGSRDKTIRLWLLRDIDLVAEQRYKLLSFPYQWKNHGWPSEGPSMDAFYALSGRVETLEMRVAATSAPTPTITPTPTASVPSTSSLDELVDAVNDMVRAVNDLDNRVARLERALGDFPASNLIWEIDNMQWEIERIWDSIEALQN